MLKKIMVSILFFFIYFLIGCQNTTFSETQQNASSKKTVEQTGHTAWIYTPSTRTIPNTMTEYDAPLEFTVNDIIVTEQLPVAKNLKNDYEDNLNTFIEEITAKFGEKVLHDIDFSSLHQQTNFSSNSIENHIFITGNLSFIGPYASIYLTATPSVVHQYTGETVDLSSFTKDTFSYATFYHVQQKKEVPIEQLFLQNKQYLSIIEKQLQKELFFRESESFNIIKRPFSNLSENDILLSYHNGLDTNTSPYFLVTLKKENPYCINETNFEIDLSLLLPYLSFSPNEIEDIMDIPNLLTKQLIDTTDTFTVEQDTSITVEGCSNSFFICVRNYKNQEMTENVNEQLSAVQRTYINTTPLSAYFSDANTPSLKVVSYKGLGPFLKVFILSDIILNNKYMFNQQNILIYMPTGEQMTVRDLLLPETIDKLTEQQLYYLDTTNFTLDSTGTITVPLETVAEDGSMNLTYESKLFNFAKYSNF